MSSVCHKYDKKLQIVIVLLGGALRWRVILDHGLFFRLTGYIAVLKKEKKTDCEHKLTKDDKQKTAPSFIFSCSV